MEQGLNRQVIYLAGPYTSADAAGRAERFDALTKAAAKFISKGYIVYSPITHTHPIDVEMIEMGITNDSDYWCDFDETFMSVCTDMVILMLPGWQESSGIAREIEYFSKRECSIHFLPVESSIDERKV